jgi:hypothetical protein
MKKVYLNKEKLNNFLTKKNKCSWPTDILLALALFAETQTLMATNAKDAALP